MSGIPGVVDFSEDPGDPGVDQQIDPSASKKLTVPGNILPWIEDAAQQFGVPRELLAAVVYQHSKFSGLTPSIIAQVAASIADNFNYVSDVGFGRHGGLTTGDSSDYPQQDLENAWLDAATMYAYGTTSSSAAQAYRGSLGNVYGPASTEAKAGKLTVRHPVGLTLGPDTKLPAGKFTTARFPGGIGGGAAYGPGGAGGAGGGGAAKLPIIPGLSDDAAVAAQRVADTLYLNYLGRFPTTQEYNDISREGFTPQTLEEHLRAQPYNGTTVGQWQDAKIVANKEAQKQFGRDADAGEISFLVQNGVTGADQIGAYYEQLRTRRDSGDPAFAWAADPATWKRAESQVQSAWDKAGLTGVVDPHLVNQVVTGKMGADQIAAMIDKLPAPGFAQGQSVGAVNRIRALAEQTKGTLLPEEPVTDTEISQFLSSSASPDDIRNYYRSIVPKSSKTGMPIGIESDYRSMADSVLSKYGVAGYAVTPEDLKFFALTKADPSAILAHLAEKPELAAAHPGLRYGMQSEDYKTAVQAYGSAFGGAFPGQDVPKDLLDMALKQGITPGQVGDTAETFRQERGRAPTAGEFSERLNRPSRPNRGGGAGIGVTMTDAGPASSPGGTRGTPRPAVGGKKSAA